MHYRLWAEVSLGTLSQNFHALQRLTGPQNTICAVVKADAYGHGLTECALALQKSGARHFATATLDEAIRLRDAGITATIYMLSPLLPDEASACGAYHLVPFVSSLEFYEALPKDATCFLVIDSGMGREGMAPELGKRLILEDREKKIIGLATHFSSADDDDLSPTVAQTEVFSRFVAGLGAVAAERTLSLDNSPALLRAPHGELHRPGAALYGISPFPQSLDGTGIEPVLTLKARVTLVKRLPAGATVGYGRTHTLTRNSLVATVPVGYGDGWLRSLSNRGFALLRGKRCPLIGRVSMDQAQLDVTELGSVAIGETATLLGSDGNESVTAAELASLAGTTCHEITTQLSARIPRVYTD